jgi:hypothetical protein
MKFFLILSALFFWQSSAKAEFLSCYGNAYSSGGTISGQCHNGRCSGYLPGESLSAYGNCNGGVRFDARSYTAGSYLNGECRNGSFSAFTSGENISWTGSCSNGGSFSGSSYSSGGYINGSCQEDGSFFVNLYGSSLSINGSCNSYFSNDE